VTADLEIVLDVREWRSDLREAAQIGELWASIEPALARRDLSSRPTYTLGHPDGDIHIALLRVRPGASPVVGPATTFHIVSMLEPSRVRYRCQECAALGRTSYGSFTCRDCGADDLDKRLCDEHVRILDGALISTCGAHEPNCVECGAKAGFRCAGSGCQRSRAHCSRHRIAHPHDKDVSYCPTCYTHAFPACEQQGCRNVGTGRCEVTESGLRACGAKACAKHLRRWQVFGAEGLGLALCERHNRELRQYPPEQLLTQIVGGAFRRSARRRDAEPLPSLRGFAHSLRNQGHGNHALDFTWIFQTLEWVQRSLRPDAPNERRALDQLLNDRRDGGKRPNGPRPWRKELAGIGVANQDGEALVERLRQLVRQVIPHHGETVAAGLSLANYNPPRRRDGEMRPGLLFVHLADPLRAPFIGAQGRYIKYFSEQLSAGVPGGVSVRIEGDRRGGRR
jgi:hypothetical protein